MHSVKVPGLVSMDSRHSVDEAVARLTELLESKGIKLFAVIDHSGEAAKIGQQMPSTKVIIFGNPRAGTPLMLAAPSVAIDLPLKLLIAETADGCTISYNSPVSLLERHNLPRELAGAVEAIEALAAKIAE